MMLGASRKYSCMNPVGRRCVHARPDFSRCSSMSLCIWPNGNVVSCRASKPENLITWRTPAALAASINVFCVSTISMRGAEIIRTRSTPSRADSKLLGLDVALDDPHSRSSFEPLRLRSVTHQNPYGDALADEFVCYE